MRAAILLTLLMLVVPPPAHAWGFQAHKFIMDRAIALLPAEIRPLFEAHRAEVVERAIDPDTWIIAGWEEERPHHFVDMDSPGFGEYPFTELPRDYTAALAKFGAAKMRDAGTVPWTAEEVYGSLRRAFDAYPRRGNFGPNAHLDVILFSAWLAHYTSDAHVPLHGVSNYDGQLTQQWGVHARWEATLFERYLNRLTIAPKAIGPIKDPRGFLFDALLQDTQLVPALLKADRDAIADRDVYDAAYYEAFFKAQRATMEERLDKSIAAVAAMITGAWEAAGKPAVSVNLSSTPQRRRRQ
jgi:hypothetical protein